MSEAATSKTVESKRGKRVERIGLVVSDKGDKTIRVRYRYLVKHPKYGKFLRRSTTLCAHDEKNTARVGDLVEVAGCRRLSKSKCWRLTRIIERTDVVL